MIAFKIIFSVLFLISAASLIGGWYTDIYGGADAHVNMNSLPLYVLGAIAAVLMAVVGIVWFIVSLALEI